MAMPLVEIFYIMYMVRVRRGGGGGGGGVRYETGRAGDTPL